MDEGIVAVGATSDSQNDPVGNLVLKQGWCIKESGTTFLRTSNWRRRWFILKQENSTLTLSYYKQKDNGPAKGKICLDSTYTARELEIDEEKQKSNCFAIGPIFNDPTIRTYYISCESESEKLNWMSVINAGIEGTSKNVNKHAKSFKQRYHRISCRKMKAELSVPVPEEPCKFDDPSWRLLQWQHLCDVAFQSVWKKVDIKNGVTIARQAFKDNPFAVIKMEGIVEVSPHVILEYFQKATRPGGKLDYPVRNAILLQRINDSFPHADIFYSQFDVPIPGVATRDCVWLKMEIEHFTSQANGNIKLSGLLISSVSHPSKLSQNKQTRIELGCSGIVIIPQDLNTTAKVIILAQVDVQNSLQSMLEGSYKSGLLKIGLRNAFLHVRKNIEEYNNLVNGLNGIT